MVPQTLCHYLQFASCSLGTSSHLYKTAKIGIRNFNINIHGYIIYKHFVYFMDMKGKKQKHASKSLRIKYVTFCVSLTSIVVGGNASLLVQDLRVGGFPLIGFFKFLACTTHVRPNQLYNNVSHTYSSIIEFTMHMHLN